jgi:hypothetical protein
MLGWDGAVVLLASSDVAPQSGFKYTQRSPVRGSGHGANQRH